MEDASSEEAVFSDIQQEGGDSFVFVEKFDDVVSVEGSVAGESPFFFPSTIKPLADSGASGEPEWHHQAAKSYVSNFHHPEERELVEDLLLSVDKFSEETDVVKLSTESDWKRLRSFIAEVVKAREKLNEAITRASLGSSDPLAAEEVTEKVIKKVIKNATQRLEAVETKRGYLRVLLNRVFPPHKAASNKEEDLCFPVGLNNRRALPLNLNSMRSGRYLNEKETSDESADEGSSTAELGVFTKVSDKEFLGDETSKDQSELQAVRDVERDSFVINGEAISGATGYKHVLQRLRDKLCLSDPSISLLSATKLAKFLLRWGNRTQSGGDAHEAAAFLMSHAADVLLAADNSLVFPVQFDIKVGDYHGVSATGITIEAPILFRLCDPDPSNEEDAVWARLKVTYRRTVIVKLTSSWKPVLPMETNLLELDEDKFSKQSAEVDVLADLATRKIKGGSKEKKDEGAPVHTEPFPFEIFADQPKAILEVIENEQFPALQRSIGALLKGSDIHKEQTIPEPLEKEKLADGIEIIEAEKVSRITADTTLGPLALTSIPLASVTKNIAAGDYDRAVHSDLGLVLRNSERPLPMHTQAYSWGRNQYGVLGTGDDANSARPLRVHFSTALGLVRIRKVSCGWYHTLALTDVGLLYSWGNGSDGALGHGDTNACLEPRLVEFFGVNNTDHLVADVAAGGDVAGSHSAAITRSGKVFTWGIATALGVGETKSSPLPLQIESAEFEGEGPMPLDQNTDEDSGYAEDAQAENGERESKTAMSDQQKVTPVAITAGGGFVVVVLSNGAVYSWGKSANGRLGLGPRKNVPKFEPFPKKMETLWKAKVAVVKVAAGESHVICLDASGDIFTWGKGDSGQLGHGGTYTSEEPVRIRVFSTEKGVKKKVVFRHIGAGVLHTLAVSMEGHVYTWGGNGGPMLGHGDRNMQWKSAVRLQRILKARAEAFAKAEEGKESSSTSEPTVAPPTGADQEAPGPASVSHIVRRKPWLKPRKVKAFGIEDPVVQIDGGALHSAAVTASGFMYIWGDRRDGALGNGFGDGEQVPRIVTTGDTDLHSMMLKERVPWWDRREGGVGWGGFDGSGISGELCETISCGGWHTVAITSASFLGLDLRLALSPVITFATNGYNGTGWATNILTGATLRVRHDDDKGSVSALSKGSMAGPQVPNDSFDWNGGNSGHHAAITAADMVIISEGRRIRCHKAVLSAASVILSLRIEERTIPGVPLELFLPELSFDGVILMLEFLYTDNISTTLSPLSPVLRELSEAADALEIPRLTAFCRALSSSTISRLTRLMNRRAENDEERDEDAEDPYFDADQEAGKSAETDGWEDIVSRKQLHHNLGDAFFRSEWPDVVFIAEGEEFPAHRAIVCARCAYFATLFTTDLAEGAEDDEGVVQVEVPDPAPVFQRLLVFLYTGCSAATTNQEILQDLVCADRYGVPRLKALSESLVSLTKDTVSSTLELADLVTAPRLKERCFSFIMQDVGRVANTKAFSTMVERSPAIVEGLARRLKQRNATYFEVLDDADVALLMKDDPDQELFTGKTKIPWLHLIALVLLIIVYTYVAQFNVSFGYVVPVVNVAMVAGTVYYGIRSLRS